MLYFDAETYNESVPIKHGTYKYVSTCEPLIVTYAFDDQPVQVWDCTRQGTMPGDLDYALHDDGELICAHSSMFDRNVLKYAHGINIPIHRWRDTMVKALAHGLPGGLDKLCVILNVPEELAKHQGKQLINLFTKPRGAHVKIRRATRETHPKEWQDFIQYASKYKTLLNATMPDGRLRGSLQFDGAQRTGRWAGRGFQPQNMPRPDMSIAEINEGIDAIKGGYIDLITDNVMRVASNAIRGCIIAPSGKKLVVADLSNIEGRDAAWIAGETWKLKAFADYDAGIGPDLYKLSYAKSFRIAPEEVTKEQRNAGKVQELMLAYQGGVGAYITGAATYNIDLDAMAKNSIDMLVATEPEVWQEASEFWTWVNEKKRPTFGLDRETFMVCDSFKRLWRRNHPNIVRIWQDLEDYVTLAIDQPGKTFQCRVLKIRRDGAWLRIQLPSGRSLCYPSPQVIDKKITYMGINQYSHQWRRIATYGGPGFVKVCQTNARGLMGANKPAR